MTFSEESTKIDKLLERTRYFRYIELFYTRRVVYVTQFAREELIRDSHKYFLIPPVMYRNFKSKISRSFLGYKIVTVVSKFISEISFNQSKIKEYYFVTYDEWKKFNIFDTSSFYSITGTTRKIIWHNLKFTLEMIEQLIGYWYLRLSARHFRSN